MTLLIVDLRVLTLIGLFVEDFEFFIDEVSFFILPASVWFFDAFNEYSGAVFMVEVVFLEREHLAIELLSLVPSFEVFFKIQQVLNIFIENVDIGPLFLDDLVDLVGVEVGLGGRKFIIQSFLHRQRPFPWSLSHTTDY